MNTAITWPMRRFLRASGCSSPCIASCTITPVVEANSKVGSRVSMNHGLIEISSGAMKNW
ncbi:hypothetical protein D3C72_2188360 [compost metagenome]